jgi:hypothetical protein
VKVLADILVDGTGFSQRVVVVTGGDNEIDFPAVYQFGH